MTEASGLPLATLDGILIEEEVTNTARGRYISSGFWGTDNASISDDYTASFSALATAGIRNGSTASNGADWTVSCYARSDDAGAKFRIRVGDTNGYSPDFDLTTEWQRFEFTRAANNGTDMRFSNATDGLARTIQVKDYQAEEALYSTSFIPQTITDAVNTRLADDCTATWPANLVNDFSINANVKFSYLGTSPSTRSIYGLHDGGGQFLLGHLTSNGYLQARKASSISQYNLGSPADQHYDFTGRYSSVHGVTIFVDGTQGNSNANLADVSAPNPLINIGASNANLSKTNGAIKNFTIKSLDTVNGFTLGSGAGGYNDSGENFVAFPFTKSPIAGMDIVEYIGTGDGQGNTLVAHGLGVKPEMWFLIRASAQNDTVGWAVYNETLTASNRLRLDSNAASIGTTLWGDPATEPTDTHFTVNGIHANNAGSRYITYLFASVPGFSKVFSYTGNGSADGPFVHLGFKPAFILRKPTGSGSWGVWDILRDPHNPADTILSPDATSVEASGSSYYTDFLSNGFKARGTSWNANGSTYVGIAFAEQPFGRRGI